MGKGSPAAQSRLFFKLQRAAHLLKKQADDALLPAGGITTAQAAALMIIARNAPISQRQLAQMLDQNESAITAMVRRLIALQLVERRRSVDDVRRWELAATAAGEGALEKAGPAFGQINRMMEQRLSAGEIATLADLLNRLIMKEGVD